MQQRITFRVKGNMITFFQILCVFGILSLIAAMLGCVVCLVDEYNDNKGFFVYCLITSFTSFIIILIGLLVVDIHEQQIVELKITSGYNVYIDGNQIDGNNIDISEYHYTVDDENKKILISTQ